MGDLNEMSFMEAWHSATFQKLRAANLSMDVTGTPCEQCVAYREAEDWLDAVLAYIAANAARVEQVFAERTPEIKVSPLQGTYLQWFDCRSLGLGKEGLEDLMLNKARIYLDEGYIFGPEGEGFERINLACPRAIVDKALDRITAAIGALKTQ